MLDPILEAKRGWEHCLGLMRCLEQILWAVIEGLENPLAVGWRFDCPQLSTHLMLAVSVVAQCLISRY